MKICPNCGSANAKNATTCQECMFIFQEKQFVDQSQEKPKEKSFSERLSQSMSGNNFDQQFKSSRSTDIMFVFDCTGSMRGEIKAMKECVIDFANSIITEGINMRLGLIEFRDRLVNQEHKLHKFSDGVFTKAINEFQQTVSSFKAKGGGNNKGESSPDALMLALDQPFRNIPNKTIVLITDEPPHIPDKTTNSVDEVIKKMKAKDINLYYIITLLKNPKCHKHFEILEGVQKYGGDGLVFEITEQESERGQHFGKVLLGLAKSISTKSIAM